jgi:hypothetical protein
MKIDELKEQRTLDRFFPQEGIQQSLDLQIEHKEKLKANQDRKRKY